MRPFLIKTSTLSDLLGATLNLTWGRILWLCVDQSWAFESPRMTASKRDEEAEVGFEKQHSEAEAWFKGCS